MKLLYVFYGKDFTGGSSLSMATLASEAQSAGYEVHALIPKTRNRLMKKHLQDKVAYCHEFVIPWMVCDGRSRSFLTKIKNSIKGLLWLILNLPSDLYASYLIKKFDIDLVHIGGAVIATGGRAAKWNHKALVWHIREFVVEDHRLKYFPWINVDHKYSDADTLICVSDSVKEKMMTTTSCRDIVRVYNGIVSPVSNSLKRNNETTCRFLFAGGLSETKGIFVLLNAVKLAAATGAATFSLDIFGQADEKQKEHLDKFCSDNYLSSIVRYRGLVTDLYNEYRDHSALIVASRCEAFGRVSAEAMLAGCLVIGSNAGGTTELLEHKRGILFPSGDSKALCDTLLDVAHDIGKYRACIENALDYASKEFTIQAYTSGVFAIYRKLQE